MFFAAMIANYFTIIRLLNKTNNFDLHLLPLVFPLIFLLIHLRSLRRSSSDFLRAAAQLYGPMLEPEGCWDPADARSLTARCVRALDQFCKFDKVKEVSQSMTRVPLQIRRAVNFELFEVTSQVRETAREAMILLDILQEYGREGGDTNGWPAFSEEKLKQGRGVSCLLMNLGQLTNAHTPQTCCSVETTGPNGSTGSSTSNPSSCPGELADLIACSGGGAQAPPQVKVARPGRVPAEYPAPEPRHPPALGAGEAKLRQRPLQGGTHQRGHCH